MTGIEWTEVTWNPVTGCDRISSGCTNCYALSMAKRLKAMGAPKYQIDGDPRTSGPGFAITIHPAALDIPRRWRSTKVVFVNSMSDLFHARVPEAFIRDVFEVITATPQHTYQVLTKRSLRARRLAERLAWPSNLWMGVSVEDQDTLIRAEHLLEIPAAVRFLSCEPLLGPVDLTAVMRRQHNGIGWVIVGGESGPGARPVSPEWVRGLRDHCVTAGVPFFFKQWGGHTPKQNGRSLDGMVWDQFPVNPPATQLSDTRKAMGRES
ncbi:DUF5131 family protein [Nocardia sp. NPDC004151]|uniref:DUF5131 family protein n=1 Tax=Nocardia sp. NPDC004151 TaxID=3364304 RepID=UPI00367624B1